MHEEEEAVRFAQDVVVNGIEGAEELGVLRGWDVDGDCENEDDGGVEGEWCCWSGCHFWFRFRGDRRLTEGSNWR